MKIPVKNLYLIAIISIGLIGLAVGSTYAMFTATAEINNPISLSSNLTYTSDIVETVDVSVAPGETEYVTLDVSNSSGSTLNYAIWYICDNDDVEFGTDLENYSDSTSGNIASGSYFPIGVYIRNNGTSTVTVTLGVSSSTGNVILANNMTILPNTSLPVITHTVTIKRQLGTASATTIQNLSANDGSNSSQVSVAGTTAYPTYESISCTNGQTASVTKTTSGGIDTAKVTVNNVKSDTVCTVKFKASSHTVTIKRQLGSETATTIETLSVNNGGNSSEVSVEGTSTYPLYDSTSCTNGQTASVDSIEDWIGDYPINTAYISVNNVTNDTVCTVKFISDVSYTVQIKLQLDNGTPTTQVTPSVPLNGSYTNSFYLGGQSAYFDSVSCTNGQKATVKESFGSSAVYADFSITNVTSDTVCTIKAFSN